MTILALLLSVTLQAIETYHVVPQPQDVQLQKGQPFVLDGTVQILAAEGLQREALFLRDYIKEQTGLELAITSKHNRKIRTIALTVSPSVVASEGYRLVVGKGGVNIFGGSPAGVFYGVQTLRKSLGIADSLVSLELPPVVITDAPRFSWRGMHLDCARHFFSVAFVKKFIDLLDIKTPSTETLVKQLSGGNQQKVIIARWLATNPDFLILDEPTRGIDVGTKTEIQKLVVDLARQGKSVIFISSEIEEMLRTCNRLAVLRDGEKVGELTEDLTQESVMKVIAGGERS